MSISTRISHEAFHVLFLNPPYLSVIEEGGHTGRDEKRFLVNSLCHHYVSFYFFGFWD